MLVLLLRNPFLLPAIGRQQALLPVEPRLTRQISRKSQIPLRFQPAIMLPLTLISVIFHSPLGQPKKKFLVAPENGLENESKLKFWANTEAGEILEVRGELGLTTPMSLLPHQPPTLMTWR